MGLNKVVLLDVDVFGGINIKTNLKNCLSIFIMPPSKNELLNRLKKRFRVSFTVARKRTKWI